MNSKESQLDRFKEAARELGADESPDALDRWPGILVSDDRGGDRGLRPLHNSDLGGGRRDHIQGKVIC